MLNAYLESTRQKETTLLAKTCLTLLFVNKNKQKLCSRGENNYIERLKFMLLNKCL